MVPIPSSQAPNLLISGHMDLHPGRRHDIRLPLPMPSLNHPPVHRARPEGPPFLHHGGLHRRTPRQNPRAPPASAELPELGELGPRVRLSIASDEPTSSCDPFAPASSCALPATPNRPRRHAAPPWRPPPPISLQTVPPTDAITGETPAPSRPRHSMLWRTTEIHFRHLLPHFRMEWPRIHRAIHSRKVPFRMADRRLAHAELRLTRRRAWPSPPPMSSPPTSPAKPPSPTAISFSYLPSAPPPLLADDIPVGHGSAARIPSPSSSPHTLSADDPLPARMCATIPHPNTPHSSPSTTIPPTFPSYARLLPDIPSATHRPFHPGSPHLSSDIVDRPLAPAVLSGSIH